MPTYGRRKDGINQTWDKKNITLKDITLLDKSYYENLHQRTLVEWKKFISGERNIDTSVVSQELLDSWIRCVSMGIDPLAKAHNKILEGEELKALLSKNKALIDASLPFMISLYEFLEGPGFIILLFDRESFILETICSPEDEQYYRMNDVMVGSLWDEKTTGNTAGSIVVVTQKPIQMFGSQQYLQIYHRSTSSGAPIFDTDGCFLGAIVISGHYYRTTSHTLGMLIATANSIKNELLVRKTLAEIQVAYSYQQTVISSIMQALIAVDFIGRITLINEKARTIFGLGEKKVEGLFLRDVVNFRNTQFFKLIETPEAFAYSEVRIFSENSSSDFTLTYHPIMSPEKIVIGKVILLDEIQRAKSLVTKMIGARANLRFEDILGQNSRFLTTVEQARMASESNSTVLLLGKSGTGKDIFAQAIHNLSERRTGPYVAINCGAIPRELIATELFGHDEGAYTGSRRGGNQGKFELADSGTLFLDEIAETPLELQTALLRVIEDKSVLRVGGNRVRPVDVRIIAATNKDLLDEVRKGNFREDLYYRINVFSIEMIPLEERLDDIPLLANCFIERCADVMDKHIRLVDNKVIEAFMSYSWPGNVRELQNVIERMINCSKTEDLTIDLIPSYILHPTRSAKPQRGSKANQENLHRTIEKMLSKNIHKDIIAEKLNISRATLYRKIKKYNLV